MNNEKMHNNNTIIVAIDFSEASLNAAGYAAVMAAILGKELLLLHIAIVQVAYSEFPVIINTDEMVRDAEHELEAVRVKLKEQHPGVSDIKLAVRVGTFFTELQHVCEEIQPYAVVMGSQGTSAVQRAVFGGHSVYTMQHLNWTVITVPLGAGASAIKKIGLACDFDNVIYKIPVEELKILVKDFQAGLQVLHVGEKGTPKYGVAFESGLLQRRLKELNPVYHFITSEHIDEAIIDFADKNQLDLLIVLPKQRNLFRQLLHRSHTKQLVLHAHVPVMSLYQ